MPIRCLLLTAALALTLGLGWTRASRAQPQPRLIAHIARVVFGSHWRTAACIARHESTDGAYLTNGYWRHGLFYGSLGPWQIEAEAHRQYDAKRLISDWWYSARAAYRISHAGTDWSAWTTAPLCGA